MLVYNKITDIPQRPLLRITAPDSRGSFTAVFGSKIKTELTLPRSLICGGASLSVYSDDSGESTEYEMSSVASTPTSDIYRASLNSVDICHPIRSGLFYLTFRLKTPYGEAYVSDGGAAGCVFTDCKDNVRAFQLLVYENNTHPSFLPGGIIYHIFVDRFAKGDKPLPERDDAIYEPDWYADVSQYPEKPGDPVENNLFYGGDLWGAAAKLPYIASLGVNCVYLSPVFEAYSNHRYDTSDYMRVDPQIGGDEALYAFIKAASKLKISVILDGVFNHTGFYSRYFNGRGRYKLPGAYESPSSPYYIWYTFEHYPDKYRCWWGVKALPAVKNDEPSYIDFICGSNGVAEKWLSAGIKGFRLDVADELSDAFLDNFRHSVKSHIADSYIVGEVWEDASNKVAYGKRRRYLRGRQLDSVMNYPLRDAVVSYLTQGKAEAVGEVLNSLIRNYPPSALDTMMNILGTHDTERIITVLGGKSAGDRPNNELVSAVMTPEEKERGLALLKIAWLLLIAAPGIPCIYYGDEAGLEGYRDPFNRRGYPWGREDGELLMFYRACGQIRAAHKVFAHGETSVLKAEDGCLVFERYNKVSKAVFFANMSDKPSSFFIGEGFISAFTEEAQPCAVVLPPRTAELYITEPSSQSAII